MCCIVYYVYVVLPLGSSVLVEDLVVFAEIGKDSHVHAENASPYELNAFRRAELNEASQHADKSILKNRNNADTNT